ncbi:sulfotransferase [Thalassospira sp. MA62]|nr:sulfotransferase [Thalassospira sp. MA62]
MAQDLTRLPVFVGGTGRSGTSLMGDLIGSHRDFHLPVHENKLIVERAGLRDVIRDLSGIPDLMRRHFAILHFYARAQKMRAFGFQDPALNKQVQSRMNAYRENFQQAIEHIQRQNPQANGSIHAIGAGFGLPHYDKCVNDFVRILASHIDQNGIYTVDGLLRPFFVTQQFERNELLELSRDFLSELYRGKSSLRWVDDTPANALAVDFLAELFPGMRFINMVRDPSDTISSYVKQVWFPSDIKMAEEYICSNLLATEALMANIPSQLTLTVRMEDLVADPKRTFEKLADFLNVPNEFNARLIKQGAANIGRSQTDPEIKAALSDEIRAWMMRHDYA